MLISVSVSNGGLHDSGQAKPACTSHVRAPPSPTPSPPPPPVGGQHTYKSEFCSQVVRSVLWSDSGALVSGGEDARLVQWSVQPCAAAEQTQTSHKPSQRVSNAVTKKDQATRRRQSPY